MLESTTPVDTLLQLARAKHAQTSHVKSKLEPHRAFIFAAVSESLPIATVQDVLEEHCDLKVSYSNLRAWIRRQPEFRKATKGAGKSMTKAEEARWEKLANRDPNEPLTLTRKRDQKL